MFITVIAMNETPMVPHSMPLHNKLDYYGNYISIKHFNMRPRFIITIAVSALTELGIGTLAIQRPNH